MHCINLAFGIMSHSLVTNMELVVSSTSFTSLMTFASSYDISSYTYKLDGTFITKDYSHDMDMIKQYLLSVEMS